MIKKKKLEAKFKIMTDTAKGLENTESSLDKFSPYQTLIATQMWTDKNKSCCAKIPAGNGKTLCIVKLFKRCSQEYIKFVIVVSNDMLYRKM